MAKRKTKTSPAKHRIHPSSERRIRASISKDLIDIALGVAAYIAEHTPRPAGVPVGCCRIDQIDSDRMRRLVTRIATIDNPRTAQEELDAAIARRVAPSITGTANPF